MSFQPPRPGQILQQTQFMSPRQGGPPIGKGISEAQLEYATAFWRDAPDLQKYVTPFVNQQDYPRNKTSEVQFFVRNLFVSCIVDKFELIMIMSLISILNKLFFS